MGLQGGLCLLPLTLLMFIFDFRILDWLIIRYIIYIYI